MINDGLPLWPSNNILSALASQLIRYVHCCPIYNDFLSHHSALVTRILSHSYKANYLSDTFQTFYGSHTDLNDNPKNVCLMFEELMSADLLWVN